MNTVRNVTTATIMGLMHRLQARWGAGPYTGWRLGVYFVLAFILTWAIPPHIRQRGLWLAMHPDQITPPTEEIAQQ